MTLDLDRLEALAKVATPGPWRGDRIDGTVKYDIVAGDYPNGEYTVVCHGDNGNASDGGYGFTSAENEDYALAANPSTILALIAEVRALREDKARLDSGCIVTHERDEFGEEYTCERRGNDLRAMIDAARREKA
ncbi:hypothetical protein CIW54_07690 [Paraburkholderia sp. T12-10]|nr:hypothetical protein CIW54_07690 [Paraburkholderia sp. T12-10]